MGSGDGDGEGKALWNSQRPRVSHSQDCGEGEASACERLPYDGPSCKDSLVSPTRFGCILRSDGALLSQGGPLLSQAESGTRDRLSAAAATCWSGRYRCCPGDTSSGAGSGESGEGDSEGEGGEDGGGADVATHNPHSSQR